MRRFIHSCRFAATGLLVLMREPNARIHLAAATLVVAAGIVLGLNPVEWCLITLCIGFVLTTEAVNTALEHLGDAVTRDRNPRIKSAKDCAAGAVLVASLASAITGAIIFLPKIHPLFFPPAQP